MHADLKDWHAKAVASIKSLRSQNADVHAEIESLDQKLAWAQVSFCKLVCACSSTLFSEQARKQWSQGTPPANLTQDEVDQHTALDKLQADKWALKVLGSACTFGHSSSCCDIRSRLKQRG